MADAQPAELAGDVVAIAGGRLGEPVAEVRRRGVDADGPAGLGVDEVELADVRELVLTRVADLHDQDAVALGDAAQLRPPVERSAEVRDEHDEPAGRRPVGDELQGRLAT